MPQANFCRDCGAELPRGREESGYAEYGGYDPYGYRPSTIAMDGTAVPGDLADVGTRTGAWLITNVAVQIIGAIPGIGWIISFGAFFWTLMLFRRGQDVGARLTGIRVVRDTGDLAGFYQMWVRGIASVVSLIVVGAGYWTAYSDPDRRTWHDKWMGTYVVKDAPALNDRPGTSSDLARILFWVSLVAGVILVYALLNVFGFTAEELAGY